MATAPSSTGDTQSLGAATMQTPYSWPKVFAIAFICALVVGTRVAVPGTDTYAYMISYERAPIDLAQSIASPDPGYRVLVVASKWLGLDYRVFQFLISLATTFLFVRFIFRHSSNVLLSIFLFLFLGFFVQQFNAARQMLAAGLLLLSTDHVLHGKFFRHVLYCLIASTLHFTALVMIPAYYFMRSRPWSFTTLSIALVSVAMLVQLESIVDLTMPFWDQSSFQYAGDLAGMAQAPKGANPLRAAVYAVPTVCSLLLAHRYATQYMRERVLVNSSLVSSLIYVFALYHLYLARFAFYTVPFSLILLPDIFMSFDRRIRVISVVYACCLYIVFLYFDVGGAGYSSFLFGTL